MKILVLYRSASRKKRNTIEEHLWCFKKYSSQHAYHYVNVLTTIPAYLQYVQYDGIIFHYTFCGTKVTGIPGKWENQIKGASSLKGYKVAIPQDEYDGTGRLCELYRTAGVKTVFTCFEKKEDYLKAYPPGETGVEHYIPVFTGYIDEENAARYETMTKPYAERPIDIGYRARKLPYYFGKHGQLKYEISVEFQKVLKGTDFVFDISNTGDKYETFLGNKWYEFLLSCKATLGCMGGSSLLDRDGEFKQCVNDYIQAHPEASFNEVEEHCFKGHDFNIDGSAISPRHFEAAITKTLQVLVEGNYAGIFKPDVHFIELKRDFSNIKEVLSKLKDVAYCQNIIDNTYEEIVKSGKYTYRSFSETVLSHISRYKPNINTNTFRNTFFFKLIGTWLTIRETIIMMLLAGIGPLLEELYKTNLANKIRKNKRLYQFLSRYLP